MGIHQPARTSLRDKSTTPRRPFFPSLFLSPFAPFFRTQLPTVFSLSRLPRWVNAVLLVPTHDRLQQCVITRFLL